MCVDDRTRQMLGIRLRIVCIWMRLPVLRSLECATSACNTRGNVIHYQRLSLLQKREASLVLRRWMTGFPRVGRARSIKYRSRLLSLCSLLQTLRPAWSNSSRKHSTIRYGANFVPHAAVPERCLTELERDAARRPRLMAFLIKAWPYVCRCLRQTSWGFSCSRRPPRLSISRSRTLPE